VLAGVLFSTLYRWGAGAALIQPDLALAVTALAFVAELSITVMVSCWSAPGISAGLVLSSIGHVQADGWLPTWGSGSTPRLVLLSQPRR
jgi:hypothetical protein